MVELKIPLKNITAEDEPRPMDDITRLILEPKRPDIAEIELTLFENCHLNCSFCHHDKKSTVGLSREEIFSKLSIVEDHLIKMKDRVDICQINMVGGELFQDRISEWAYPVYYDFLIEIKKLYDKYGHTIKVVWVTSFQFVKRERVQKLIDDLNAASIPSYIICSYDFDGRPVKGPYAKNIEYFADYITSINMVATTISIEKFMADEDEYFHYLYDKFDNFYFDDYIPDKGYDYMIPSDSLYLEFLKFTYHNYPNINPIKDLIYKDNNHMHCLSLNKVTIFPDNSTSNCRWDRYTPSDFNTPLHRPDNTSMMQAYMDEHGCLSCKWWDKCGFRCYTQWDWKNRERDLPDCVMRLWFNYMDKTPQNLITGFNYDETQK
jgi:hypothetical protein